MKEIALIIALFAFTFSLKAQCVANAGPDQAICGNSVTLTGSISNNPGSTAQWSCTISGVTFSNPSNTVTQVNVSAAAQNISIPVVLTETNTTLGCSSADTTWLNINSMQPSIPLVDESDSINCGRSFERLNAQYPAYGIGYWYDAVANTIFYPNPTLSHPDSAKISSSAYGMHYFYWVTVNGDCRDTSDVVPVNFIRQPVANAGGHYNPGLFGLNSEIKTDTVCGTCTIVNAVPSYGQGHWFTLSPNISFSSFPQNYYDTACVQNNSILDSPGYVEFVWIEDNNSCVDKDTLRISFAPKPSGHFSWTMPSCRYDCSMLIAHEWPLPNNIDYGINALQWDIGNGELCEPVNVNTSDTLYVHWNSGDTHPVTLVTHNFWGCISPIQVTQILEPPLFQPDYQINPSTCNENNAEIIMNPSNEFSSFWLDPLISNPNDTILTGLIPNHSYGLVLTGQSLSPDAAPGTICHDTIDISIPTSLQPMAIFDTNFVNHVDVPVTLNMVNLSVSANEYSWIVSDDFGNTIFTTTDENPDFTFTIPGCYSITLIATEIPPASWFGIPRENCTDTYTYQYLCLWPASVEIENVESEISIFPNPTKGNVRIIVNVSEKTGVDYRLVNSLGQVIYIGNSESPIINIDLSDFSDGIYLLNVLTHGKKISRQIMKVEN